MSPPLTLTIDGVSAGYPRKPVLERMSVANIHGGRVSTLVGPNGAGKSTLLRAIAGLLPARGSIRIDDTELIGASARDRARWITFMPQSLPQRIGLTVFEAMLSALRASPLEDLGFAPMSALERRAMSALDRVGIADLAMRPLDHLSGGERQLASLAQSVVREPRVLLLDEPTSALDLGHQVSVMKLVRALAADGRIVVAVLHDLNLAARWADHIIVLHQGRVECAGPPAEALTAGVLARVYGVHAVVARDHHGRATISVEGLIE
jgi:iron complex transport system ATP-binding protein